jgi:hypothetical protein
MYTTMQVFGTATTITETKHNIHDSQLPPTLNAKPGNKFGSITAPTTLVQHIQQQLQLLA